MFEAVLTPRTRWRLSRASAEEVRLVIACITELENDPFPPSERLGPLVLPHERVYPNAFVCDGWRIAFHVEDNQFLIVDAIGREWPPIDPALRGGRRSP